MTDYRSTYVTPLEPAPPLLKMPVPEETLDSDFIDKIDSFNIYKTSPSTNEKDVNRSAGSPLPDANLFTTTPAKKRNEGQWLGGALQDLWDTIKGQDDIDKTKSAMNRMRTIQKLRDNPPPDPQGTIQPKANIKREPIDIERARTAFPYVESKQIMSHGEIAEAINSGFLYTDDGNNVYRAWTNVPLYRLNKDGSKYEKVYYGEWKPPKVIGGVDPTPYYAKYNNKDFDYNAENNPQDPLIVGIGAAITPNPRSIHRLKPETNKSHVVGSVVQALALGITGGAIGSALTAIPTTGAFYGMTGTQLINTISQDGYDKLSYGGKATVHLFDILSNKIGISPMKLMPKFNPLELAKAWWTKLVAYEGGSMVLGGISIAANNAMRSDTKETSATEWGMLGAMSVLGAAFRGIDLKNAKELSKNYTQLKSTFGALQDAINEASELGVNITSGKDLLKYIDIESMYIQNPNLSAKQIRESLEAGGDAFIAARQGMMLPHEIEFEIAKIADGSLIVQAKNMKEIRAKAAANKTNIPFKPDDPMVNPHDVTKELVKYVKSELDVDQQFFKDLVADGMIKKSTKSKDDTTPTWNSQDTVDKMIKMVQHYYGDKTEIKNAGDLLFKIRTIYNGDAGLPIYMQGDVSNMLGNKKIAEMIKHKQSIADIDPTASFDSNQLLYQFAKRSASLERRAVLNKYKQVLGKEIDMSETEIDSFLTSVLGDLNKFVSYEYKPNTKFHTDFMDAFKTKFNKDPNFKDIKQIGTDSAGKPIFGTDDVKVLSERTTPNTTKSADSYPMEESVVVKELTGNNAGTKQLEAVNQEQPNFTRGKERDAVVISSENLNAVNNKLKTLYQATQDELGTASHGQIIVLTAELDDIIGSAKASVAAENLAGIEFVINRLASVKGELGRVRSDLPIDINKEGSVSSALSTTKVVDETIANIDKEIFRLKNELTIRNSGEDALDDSFNNFDVLKKVEDADASIIRETYSEAYIEQREAEKLVSMRAGNITQDDLFQIEQDIFNNTGRQGLLPDEIEISPERQSALDDIGNAFEYLQLKRNELEEYLNQKAPPSQRKSVQNSIETIDTQLKVLKEEEASITNDAYKSTLYNKYSTDPEFAQQYNSAIENKFGNKAAQAAARNEVVAQHIPLIAAVGGVASELYDDGTNPEDGTSPWRSALGFAAFGLATKYKGWRPKLWFKGRVDNFDYLNSPAPYAPLNKEDINKLNSAVKKLAGVFINSQHAENIMEKAYGSGTVKINYVQNNYDGSTSNSSGSIEFGPTPLVNARIGAEVAGYQWVKEMSIAFINLVRHGEAMLGIVEQVRIKVSNRTSREAWKAGKAGYAGDGSTVREKLKSEIDKITNENNIANMLAKEASDQGLTFNIKDLYDLYKEYSDYIDSLTEIQAGDVLFRAHGIDVRNQKSELKSIYAKERQRQLDLSEQLQFAVTDDDKLKFRSELAKSIELTNDIAIYNERVKGSKERHYAPSYAHLDNEKPFQFKFSIIEYIEDEGSIVPNNNGSRFVSFAVDKSSLQDQQQTVINALGLTEGTGKYKGFYIGNTFDIDGNIKADSKTIYYIAEPTKITTSQTVNASIDLLMSRLTDINKVKKAASSSEESDNFINEILTEYNKIRESNSDVDMDAEVETMAKDLTQAIESSNGNADKLYLLLDKIRRKISETKWNTNRKIGFTPLLKDENGKVWIRNGEVKSPNNKETINGTILNLPNLLLQVNRGIANIALTNETYKQMVNWQHLGFSKLDPYYNFLEDINTSHHMEPALETNFTRAFGHLVAGFSWSDLGFRLMSGMKNLAFSYSDAMVNASLKDKPKVLLGLLTGSARAFKDWITVSLPARFAEKTPGNSQAKFDILEYAANYNPYKVDGSTFDPALQLNHYLYQRIKQYTDNSVYGRLGGDRIDRQTNDLLYIFLRGSDQIGRQVDCGIGSTNYIKNNPPPLEDWARRVDESTNGEIPYDVTKEMQEYANAAAVQGIKYADIVNGNFTSFGTPHGIMTKLNNSGYGRYLLAMWKPGINSLMNRLGTWRAAAITDQSSAKLYGEAMLNEAIAIMVGGMGTSIASDVFLSVDAVSRWQNKTNDSFETTSSEDLRFLTKQYLEDFLQKNGFSEEEAASGYEAMRKMFVYGIPSVLLDKNLSGDQSYSSFLTPYVVSKVMTFAEHMTTGERDIMEKIQSYILNVPMIKNQWQTFSIWQNGYYTDRRGRETTSREYTVPQMIMHGFFGESLDHHVAVSDKYLMNNPSSSNNQKMELSKKILGYANIKLATGSMLADAFKNKMMKNEKFYRDSPFILNSLIDKMKTIETTNAIGYCEDRINDFIEANDSQFRTLAGSDIEGNDNNSLQTTKFKNMMINDLKEYYYGLHLNEAINSRNLNIDGTKISSTFEPKVNGMKFVPTSYEKAGYEYALARHKERYERYMNPKEQKTTSNSRGGRKGRSTRSKGR